MTGGRLVFEYHGIRGCAVTITCRASLGLDPESYTHTRPFPLTEQSYCPFLYVQCPRAESTSRSYHVFSFMSSLCKCKWVSRLLRACIALLFFVSSLVFPSAMSRVSLSISLFLVLVLWSAITSSLWTLSTRPLRHQTTQKATVARQ